MDIGGPPTAGDGGLTDFGANLHHGWLPPAVDGADHYPPVLQIPGDFTGADPSAASTPVTDPLSLLGFNTGASTAAMAVAMSIR